MLRWHYRSRHESLIAVSNQEFYDNNLLIYPSVIDHATYLGLQFVYLPDAVYDRGRSSVNRKEARAVAEAAVEHYKLFPDKSLGVGTFNIKQQQAILEEIELQLRRNPEVEDFFSSNHHEHFFVKNLETIQGDERDVIFLSVGFGFDANRRLSRNFGPLNQGGGERRLNVLITRARERCVVFANFRASNLSIDNNSPFGLRALKTFLDYAENRNLTSALPSGADSDSPFEDSVYEFLRSSGFEVRKQVGCAGFRIDLAIVDPAAPGRYLLGIECDGAKYHSSTVARDRDRLRQQILERLGWRIHRTWSTDWYRNRYDAEQRLLKAVEEAKSEEPSALDPTPLNPEPTPVRVQFDNLVSDVPEKNEKRKVYDDPFEGLVSDYEICLDVGIPTLGELHKQPTNNLAKAVTTVVNVEGPVHLDEVVKRIREYWGLKRAGQRIKRAIERGVAVAEAGGKIERRNAFLWPTGNSTPPVRRRIGDLSPKIEMICPEEIEEAIALVLRHQFDTRSKDLVVQVSRLFGFKATRDTTAKAILHIVDQMVTTQPLR